MNIPYVLYYSNTCNTSRRLLQNLAKNTSLSEKLNFVCIDQRIEENGRTFAVLQNGRKIPIPNLQGVPALFCMPNKTTYYENDITDQLSKILAAAASAPALAPRAAQPYQQPQTSYSHPAPQQYPPQNAQQAAALQQLAPAFHNAPGELEAMGSGNFGTAFSETFDFIDGSTNTQHYPFASIQEPGQFASNVPSQYQQQQPQQHNQSTTYQPFPPHQQPYPAQFQQQQQQQLRVPQQQQLHPSQQQRASYPQHPSQQRQQQYHQQHVNPHAQQYPNQPFLAQPQQPQQEKGSERLGQDAMMSRMNAFQDQRNSELMPYGNMGMPNMGGGGGGFMPPPAQQQQQMMQQQRF